MAPQPYRGSCHCGQVTYTAHLDLSNPDDNPNTNTDTDTGGKTKTGKCNCSICAKTRSWETIVAPSAFHLSPESTPYLTEYRFGTKKIAHLFCKVCGCRPFGRGVWESADGGWSGEFVAVSLACLDGVEDEVLAGLEVVYRDGREGRFGERPAVVGHL